MFSFMKAAPRLSTAGNLYQRSKCIGGNETAERNPATTKEIKAWSLRLIERTPEQQNSTYERSISGSGLWA
jgi:hypothetical protein